MGKLNVTSHASEHPVAPRGLQAERPWSSQELAVLRSLHANGESLAAIAARLRRTTQSVRNRLFDDFGVAAGDL